MSNLSLNSVLREYHAEYTQTVTYFLFYLLQSEVLCYSKKSKTVSHSHSLGHQVCSAPRFLSLHKSTQKHQSKRLSRVYQRARLKHVNWLVFMLTMWTYWKSKISKVRAVKVLHHTSASNFTGNTI